MAGKIRLFEKTATGLLCEIDPQLAADARHGRRVSRVSLEVDVIWTLAEEAERDADEAAAEAQKAMKPAARDLLAEIDALKSEISAIKTGKGDA